MDAKLVYTLIMCKIYWRRVAWVYVVHILCLNSMKLQHNSGFNEFSEQLVLFYELCRNMFMLLNMSANMAVSFSV